MFLRVRASGSNPRIPESKGKMFSFSYERMFSDRNKQTKKHPYNLRVDRQIQCCIGKGWGNGPLCRNQTVSFPHMAKVCF